VSGTSGAEVRLWIEAKNGTGLHGNQLRLYAHELAKIEALGAVLLVAPREDSATVALFPPSELANRVGRLTWQQTSRLIKQYDGAGEVGRFRDGVLGFLRSEGLMDEELTPIHHIALAHYGEAVASLLARPVRLGSRLVSEEWNTPIEPVNWRARNRVPSDRWETHHAWRRGTTPHE